MPTNEPERIYLYGGFGPRLVALLVDAILLYVLGSIVRPLLLLTPLKSILDILDVLIGSVSLGMIPGVVLLVGVVYFVALTAAWGATPGKFMLGLRVVDADGRRPSLLRVLLREVIGRPLLVYWFGPRYIASREKRGWHDHISRTWVVRPASAPEIEAEFRRIKDVLATGGEVGPDRLTGIHPSWRAALLREFARTHPEEVVVSGGILRRTDAVELI